MGAWTVSRNKGGLGKKEVEGGAGGWCDVLEEGSWYHNAHYEDIFMVGFIKTNT